MEHLEHVVPQADSAFYEGHRKPWDVPHKHFLSDIYGAFYEAPYHSVSGTLINPSSAHMWCFSDMDVSSRKGLRSGARDHLEEDRVSCLRPLASSWGTRSSLPSCTG